MRASSFLGMCPRIQRVDPMHTLIAVIVRLTLTALLMLAIAIASLGCGDKPKAASGALGPNDLSAITKPEGLTRFGSALAVSLPPEADLASLSESPLDHEVGTLRNPGRIIVVFHAAGDALKLSDDDAKWVMDWATKNNGTVYQSEKAVSVKPITGPDGETPLVMKNITRYGTEKDHPKVTVRIGLSFKTEAAAKDAMLYVSKDGYAVTLAEMEDGSPGFFATTLVPEKGIEEEWKVFEPLAKKFGGNVEFVGGGK